MAHELEQTVRSDIKERIKSEVLEGARSGSPRMRALSDYGELLYAKSLLVLDKIQHEDGSSSGVNRETLATIRDSAKATQASRTKEMSGYGLFLSKVHEISMDSIGELSLFVQMEESTQDNGAKQINIIASRTALAAAELFLEVRDEIVIADLEKQFEKPKS